MKGLLPFLPHTVMMMDSSMGVCEDSPMWHSENESTEQEESAPIYIRKVPGSRIHQR